MTRLEVMIAERDHLMKEMQRDQHQLKKLNEAIRLAQPQVQPRPPAGWTDKGI